MTPLELVRVILIGIVIVLLIDLAKGFYREYKEKQQARHYEEWKKHHSRSNSKSGEL